MHRVYTRFIISTSHTFNLLHNLSRISHFSTTSSSSSNDLTKYLVNSLGFSHKLAISTSTQLINDTKVNFSEASINAVSVVDCLKKHDFNDAHIRRVVKLYPRLLTYNADKIIQPILGLLIDHGLSRIHLIQVLTTKPSILLNDAESLFCPAFEVVRDIMVSDDLAFDVLKKLYFRNLNRVIDYLLPNVELLTSYGVPIDSIRIHLAQQPESFLQNPDTFKDVVNKIVKKLGNHPDSTMFFLYVVHLFSIYGEETIESKCRVFRSFGWTQTDIATLLMTNEKCFTMSEENITKKLGFLMNVVGLEAAFLTLNSWLFNRSLEMTMLPRHEVLQILKAKGLVNECPSFISVMEMSETRFFLKFVLPFKDIHKVYSRRIGCFWIAK